MNAERDALDRLRAADPVPALVSDPSDPRVRATLQEILMSSTTDTPTERDQTSPAPSSGRVAWFRNPRILGVAAALLLVAGVGAAALAGGSDDGADDDDEVASLPTASDGVEGDPGAGPVTEPGDAQSSELTSCVELYSPETLNNREYAFDGTVTAVDGPNMTFQVNEWFTRPGGAEGQETITLDHQGYLGMLFAPDGPSLDTGTRVLLAGDGGFVWSCGFTQLYDPTTADEWRSATAA